MIYELCRAGLKKMEKSEYINKYKIEENYWWNVGQREIVLKELKKTQTLKNIIVIDIGCGTGKLVQDLTDNNYSKVIGTDLNETAIDFCKKRKLKNIIKMDINKLPFKKKSVDVIIALDVLYHKWIKDDEFIMSKINLMLKQGGILILHLPALNWLFGQHDIVTMAKKRYNKKDIKFLADNTNFKIIKFNYRNFFLFPVALIVKLIGKLKNNNCQTEQFEINKFYNYLLKKIMRFENWLGDYIEYPFGTALLSVLIKK